VETNPLPPTDPPAIANLRLRYPDGEQEAEALAAVHAGRAAADGLDPHAVLESFPNREEIRGALAKAAASQQLDRWQVAVVSGQVAGYAALESWHEEDGRWVYLIRGWVLPQWRGQGIGTALLCWGEGQARRLAPGEHPGELFEFAGNASSTETDSAALLVSKGYWPAYTDLEMLLDPATLVPDSPLPPDVDLRPALPEHIHAIAESIAESYRSEFPNKRFLRTHSQTAGQTEWYSDPIHDRSLWQVAWAGDRVVGQVLPMIERGQVVIDEVSVRPAWRRKGLARALLTRALNHVQAQGFTAIRLYTGAEFRTRARDLYARLGFGLVKTFGRYRKLPG
jgi:mycothiol synthase